MFQRNRDRFQKEFDRVQFLRLEIGEAVMIDPRGANVPREPWHLESQDIKSLRHKMANCLLYPVAPGRCVPLVD